MRERLRAVRMTSVHRLSPRPRSVQPLPQRRLGGLVPDAAGTLHTPVDEVSPSMERSV
jgi:hypothetical protein